MRTELLANLDNPEALERLYHQDKGTFKVLFNEMVGAYPESSLLRFWSVRLNYAKEEIFWGKQTDLLFLLFCCALSYFIVRIPGWFAINPDAFYPRNASFVLFPALLLFFARKNALPWKKVLLYIMVFVGAAVYINMLPQSTKSDTLILACIHLALFCWFIVSMAFVTPFSSVVDGRLSYLRYNGDLIVMTAILLLAGGIMSAITIGLFHVIGFKIEKFYFENVVLGGVSMAPLVATYITQHNPQLVGRVAPVIARLFSPIVLIMLLVFLGMMLYGGKNPYHNREFLLIFNLLLLGVMAIIFFSVAGNGETKGNVNGWILLVLSVLTIVANGVALSAILFRISEWGFTPNRTAVLVTNVLILINLFIVGKGLLGFVRGTARLETVGMRIVKYLPVYFLWVLIVVFLFPIIFGYK